MEEKCFLCDNLATKPIGNRFICASCIRQIYDLLKEDIEEDTKHEIGHNEEIIKVFEIIRGELSKMKHDMADLKRRKR